MKIGRIEIKLLPKLKPSLQRQINILHEVIDTLQYDSQVKNERIERIEEALIRLTEVLSKLGNR